MVLISNGGGSSGELAAPPYSFTLSTISSNASDTSIKLNIVIISGGELRLFSREVVVC